VYHTTRVKKKETSMDAVRLVRQPEAALLSPGVWAFQGDLVEPPPEPAPASAPAPTRPRQASKSADTLPAAVVAAVAAAPVPAAAVPAPEFVPLTVSTLRVRVLQSAVRVEPKGQAYTSYTFAIMGGGDDDERWRVEKRFSAFLALDERVRGAPPLDMRAHLTGHSQTRLRPT
jgi:hypothetical protein